MKKYFYGLVLICLRLNAQENLWLLDNEASSYLAAGDNQKAAALYTNLNSESLAPYQKNRILYNLGTIYLSQKLPKKALELFQGIDVPVLGLPKFGKDLDKNFGFALFELALQEPLLEKQIFLTEKSLQLLEKIAKTDSLEHSLKYFEQKQREDWLKHASFTDVLSVLYERLQKPEKNLHLDSLWSALKEKTEDADKKKEIEDLFENYKKGLKDLQEGSLEKVKTIFSTLTKASLFKEVYPETSTEKKRLNYELLSLAPQLTQEEIEQINASFEVSEFKNFKANNQIEAKFYLAAALSLLPESQAESPVSILERLIVQAKLSARLFFSYSLMPSLSEESKKVFISEMNRQNTHLIQTAQTFIPAVLKEQKIDFGNNRTCQQHPWKEVIPLFEKGFLAGDNSDRILLWVEALKKLQDLKAANQEMEQTPQAVNETLRQLEEMHIEDQAKETVNTGLKTRW